MPPPGGPQKLETGGNRRLQANIYPTHEPGFSMTRALLPLALIAVLAACPTYDEYPKLSDQKGLVDADTYARYGKEQAEAMAIAREYGYFHKGETRADLQAAADSAVAYAVKLPDVVSVQADSLGHRMTIQFRSGWRTMVNPINDGKRGNQTPNLPGSTAPAN